MNIIEQARNNRRAILSALPALDDKIASTATSLFPSLSGKGDLICAGTRINWYGILKRAAVDLWDREENYPDNAPTLWENIEYREGYRVIPTTITATQSFAKGECGWWNDELYRSIIDANVKTPEEYPEGWEKA